MSIFFKKTISPVIISKKLESAIVALLDKLTNPTEDKSKKKGIWDFLNSGFIIALVAGGFVTGASTIFTQYSSENAKKVDKDLSELRQRQSFIDNFDNKIDQYLRLTYSLRKKEIFLGEWQGQKERDTIKYSDSRSFLETTVQWEQEKRFLLEHWPGSPIALVHIGRVLFANNDTRQKFRDMENALQNYDRTHDYKELDQKYNEVVLLLQTITIQLEEEARENK